MTSGPTIEPIDPVRYIANRSSGKQGHAIAAAAAAAGAEVVLVSGPVNLPDPPGISVVKVETAQQMLKAVEQASRRRRGIRRRRRRLARRTAEPQQDEEAAGQDADPGAEGKSRHPVRSRTESGRPQLVIGFAAETDNVFANAQAKLAKKGCDWILANDVSPATGIMGGDINTLHLITAPGQILAAAIERRRRAGLDWRESLPRSRRLKAVSNQTPIEVRIVRLPHARDLPLPQYQSALAAGLDLMAAVPADAPVEIRRAAAP